MKPNTWEFVRDADGIYSVFHRGELVRGSIPERWFAEEICVTWDFVDRSTSKLPGKSRKVDAPR
jgi:hypothetical protein